MLSSAFAKWKYDPIGSHMLDLECFCQRLRKTIFAKKRTPEHTRSLFVLYFGGWTLQNRVFSNQNKGHLGSRYTKCPQLKMFFFETSCYIEPPKKTAKGKTVGICQVTYVFKLQSKPPEINSSRSTPRDIQENTGINGDFCWYDFRVQSYPRDNWAYP